MKLGRSEDAITLFRKVLAIEPTHAYANHALGVAYAQTGNKTGAMQQYEVLKQLNASLAADLLKHMP
jgi:Flp pilus assembly protein TadD